MRWKPLLVLAAALAAQPADVGRIRAPAHNDTLSDQMPSHVLDSYNRFQGLTADEQRTIVDNIQSTLAKESPFLQMCGRIIDRYDVPVVTLDELLKSQDPFEKNTALKLKRYRSKNSTGSIAHAYDRSLDKIIRIPVNPSLEMMSLLSKDAHWQAIHAHETLHYAQQHASPWLGVYQFRRQWIQPDGYITFDERTSNEFGVRFFGKRMGSREAQSSYDAQYRKMEAILPEQRYIREVHTQLLTPTQLPDGSIGIVSNLDPYTKSLPRGHELVPALITTIEGYYFAQGLQPEEIEAKTAEFIGLHGDTMKGFVLSLRKQCGDKDHTYNRKGNDYLRLKADQIEALRYRTQSLFIELMRTSK
ncbi:MAG TPA: hypothetical protein VJH88_03645 [Candidatus Nanoarchaeia archaeon]|nr:hypothetical protein [Candidatus Nanoarchaeia archaeon]